jgi:hypothetical protein
VEGRQDVALSPVPKLNREQRIYNTLNILSNLDFRVYSSCRPHGLSRLEKH